MINRLEKKIWALVLAFAMTLSLVLPMAGTANAAAYTFPEYGEPVILGNHLQGNMTITEFIEHATYGGKDYLLVPAYGGKLYVFSLSDYLNAGGGAGDWIYDAPDIGLGIPTGIDSDANGNTFIIGGGNSVVVYRLDTPGQVRNISLPGNISITGISVDTYNNVFVIGDDGDAGYVYRLTASASEESGYSCTLLYSSTDIQTTSCIVTGDRATDYYIYAQATLDDGGSRIYKIHYTKGQTGTVSYVDFENTGGIYYLSYADGKLFGGHSAKINDGMIVVNISNMKKTAIEVVKNGETVDTSNSYIVGAVTEPDANGVSYMNISGVGLCRYENGTATYVNNMSFNLRDRNLYDYKNSTYVLSMNVTGTPYLFRVAGSDQTPSCADLTAGAMSTWIGRTMATGVPGVGPAVYIGGYKTGKVAGFDATAETPLDHHLFSNGHAQTDAMLAYNGKLYAGCYSGAYLVEYDPATGTVTQLIPEGLYADYGQARIHALAAGDNKIFFSTVPSTGALGGCIGWYDLTAGELYVQRNVVPNQILISLAYDEDADILYGASSVSGGSAASATATEACILAYDVAGKTVLGNFPLYTYSDSQVKVTSDITWGGNESPVKYISGLSIDPDGKLWGTFYNTLFSLTYNRSANALTVHQEWESGAVVGEPYTNSSSLNWFPRNFFYDESGYMYVTMRSGGLFRFDRSNPNSSPVAIGDTSRIYAMGTDGNLYYARGEQLYRISLNRYSMTEDLIIQANANDDASIAKAQSAYDSLNDGERNKVGEAYSERLALLQGKECLVENGDSKTYMTLTQALTNATAADTVRLLVNVAQDVPVTGGATLDLNGKDITGNVHVTNGYLTDTAASGTITGTVSVPKDNPCMPLLVPETESTYRLFAYTPVQTTAPKADDTVPGALNFWFDLDFASTQAYELLKAGSNLKVGATLSWTENDGAVESVEISFDEIVKKWAAADHTTQNQGLYVQVTGIPYFGVSNITVTPYFEAENTGLKVTLDPISHEVTQFEANAIFGAYPTDLIHK